ncbi:TRAP transporter small permease subunit [Pacificispira sp.]|uniref:TRAP transporter small permease subunit n=1 Tax=Pacificispira sp. TaxID=2888761 RepID=UPI003BA89B31
MAIRAVRTFGWGIIGLLAAFLFNNFLTNWLGWPGVVRLADGAVGGPDPRGWLQAAVYAGSVLAAAAYVARTGEHSLRTDHERAFALNAVLIRAGFWAVLLIGLVDFTLAFLKGEEFLIALVGAPLADTLGRAELRGAYLHMPLVAVGVVIALRTRALALPWLALMIVVAELLIVLFRFEFSYEQVYMGDLVRFWYATLFMLGCAYTLHEDGHVRIDLLYAEASPRRRGLVNTVGALVLGMPFCWLILIVGTAGRTGILNSALRTFEIEGVGDGMYILYLMTVLVGAFAVTLIIQFVSMMFCGMADALGEPALTGSAEGS